MGKMIHLSVLEQMQQQPQQQQGEQPQQCQQQCGVEYWKCLPPL